jgi:hypothetical protein
MHDSNQLVVLIVNEIASIDPGGVSGIVAVVFRIPTP